MNILGVDPGRDKTGLAVVAPDGTILWRAVIETPQLTLQIEPLLSKWKIGRIALGNSTSSKNALRQIEARLIGSVVGVELVDEKNSTLEARALYFEANPPRGWKRLIPVGAQVPPVPVDDFAAVVVARRSLEKRQSTN